MKINSTMVSIIIVNYNGKIDLEECLKSLSGINYKEYEVILVDNHSEDGSVEFVKVNYPEVKITKLDKNYGFAEPNNLGAMVAKGDLLLFLNNDTIVTPYFLTELVKVANADPKTTIFQSLLLKLNGDVDSSGDFVNTLGIAYNSKNMPTEPKLILSARGAAMMIRRSEFWELGGFDKNYFASLEDVDLGWRAWIFGYKSVLVPNSIVYHKGGQTVNRLDSVIRFNGVKNTLLLILVNFELTLVLSRLFLVSYIFLIKKFLGISKLNQENILLFPSYRTVIQAVLWVLKNFSYIIAKRRIVNSKRVRTTKQLIELGLITDYKK